MRGKILLGWLTREKAVVFLQKDCIFNPPLTNEEAEELWAEKRAAVEALNPRRVPTPAGLELTPPEREAVEKFLSYMRQQPGGTPHIQGVVKLDPLGLLCRQLNITLDRANQYAENVQAATWSARNCLPTHGALASMRFTRVADGWNVNLPHREFVFNFNGQAFGVGESAPFVSVSMIGARAVLWTGNHRGYARMAAANPNTADRSILAALVTIGNETVAADPSLRDLLLGQRPPFLADFLDERLCLDVELHRKRYELQIRAEIASIDAD